MNIVELLATDAELRADIERMRDAVGEATGCNGPFVLYVPPEFVDRIRALGIPDIEVTEDMDAMPGHFWMAELNIVELLASDDDCAFDQPCRFGHRVEDHAVYCHNDAWPDAPRKCRRTWATGGEMRDEDCPGFAPNTEPSPLHRNP